MLACVPRLDAQICSETELCALYFRTQLLLLDNAVPEAGGGVVRLQEFSRVLARHREAVTAGWTAEHDCQGGRELGVSQPLRAGTVTLAGSAERWYASVILSDGDALRDVMANCPAAAPVALAGATAAPHAWIFFGCNPPGSPTMQGRPEHRDDVRGLGTWHVQLAGCKVWLLRPAPAAQNCEWPSGERPTYQVRKQAIVTFLSCSHASRTLRLQSGRLRVQVNAGQVLILNTRYASPQPATMHCQ